MRQVQLKDGREAVVTDDLKYFRVGKDEEGKDFYKPVDRTKYVMAMIAGGGWQPLKRSKIAQKKKAKG